jgi:heptosyltransferase-1
VPASPPTLAIVRLSALGDLIHALPAAFDLRRRYPRSRLLWIAQREHLPLLDGLPWLDGTLAFDRGGGWRAWVDLRRRCRAERIDFALDLQGNWKSAVAALSSGARERWGLARSDQREPGCHLLFHRAAAPSSRPHAVDRARAAVASWHGEEAPSDAVDWEEVLPTCAADDELGEQLLRRLELPPRTELVLCLPTARPDPRAWPAGSWRELLMQVAADPELLPVVVTGPGEEALGRSLADGTSGERVRHLIGQHGARAAIALFRLLRERTRAAIAGDGGALHLAVAGGLRAIALAGPEDPRRTGPHGTRHALLTAPGELACRPCLLRRCRLVEGPRCLDELTPAMVLAELRRGTGSADAEGSRAGGSGPEGRSSAPRF